jgi:CHAT domain-containing protein
MGAINLKHNAWLLLIAIFLLFQESFAFDQTEDSAYLNAQLDSAEILKLKGFYNEAIDICLDIRERSLKSKHWEPYVRSFVEHADVLRFSYYYSQNISEINEALALMDDAKKILRQNLGNTSIAWLRYNIYMGKLHRYSKYAENNAADSLLIYLEAARKISEIYPSQHYKVAKINYELANYYFTRLMMVEAKPFMEKLLDITINHLPEFDYYRALYLEKIGSYYADIGDIERSALCLENALYLYHIIQKDIHNTVKTRLNLGNTYFFSNEPEKALNNYRGVIEEANRFNLTRYDWFILPNKNASMLLYKMGNIDSCIYLAEKGLQLLYRNAPTDKYNSSALKMNLGRAKYKQYQSERARKLFIQSINEITELLGEKSYEKHVNYRCIGEVYFDNDELDSALVYYQKGLIALYDSFYTIDIYANPYFESYRNMEPVLYIIFDKAKALHRRFLKNHRKRDLNASLLLYEKAYEIMRGLINDGFMDESMIILFQKFKPDFQISVECAMKAYDESGDIEYLEKVFRFIEQSKYFLLLKSQQSALLKERMGVADSLFLKERDLSKEIEFLKHQLAQKEQFAPEELYAIRNMILKKLLARNLIWNKIEEYKPADYKDDFLSLDEVQNEITDEEDIVIEYYRSDSSFVAMILGRELSEIVQIPVTPDLLMYIGDYSQSISNSNEKHSRQLFNSFVVSSNQLYKRLFSPLLHVVSEKCPLAPDAYNYTIVADGELSFLPFEAFTTSLADTSVLSYWSLPYVCKEYVINYAFSLNVQKGNRASQKRRTKNNLMAMSYSPGIPSIDKSIETGGINELPYTAREIASLGARFQNADFMLVERATENQFKEKAPDYSVIHLAIHGQADTVDRYNSRLIFRSQDDGPEDGMLLAYELYNLDLSNNQLTVLSACETGVGKQVEGEGIFSIARGFAFAGCPSLVMSLWRANDKSTYVLMNYFYENLASGMKKDEALQQAKIKFINETNDYDAHPSNWATFIALGDNEPLQMKNETIRQYVLAGFAAFIIAAIVIYRKKRIAL